VGNCTVTVEAETGSQVTVHIDTTGPAPRVVGLSGGSDVVDTAETPEIDVALLVNALFPAPDRKSVSRWAYAGHRVSRAVGCRSSSRM
jgi:hypothetical protein